jgi:uncharacterized protein (TIGR00255 family)
MTAFARGQSQVHTRLLTWELRSVNHRFLETQFRLPDPLRQLEPELREILRSRLGRGKVDCTLKLDSDAGDTLDLNRPLLVQLLAVLEKIKRDAPDMAPPNPMELLRWPGVMSATAAIDAAQFGPAVTALFSSTLGELIAHRQREGAALKDMLVTRLNEIGDIVATLRHLTADLASEVQAKLKARIAELGAEVEPGRLEQEVVLLAQRADVAEELDRLAIHLNEARDSLEGPGPHGRRLDFLTQELNREANTLAAKSLLAECSQRAVDLKVIIEQIREQVQNLE